MDLPGEAWHRVGPWWYAEAECADSMENGFLLPFASKSTWRYCRECPVVDQCLWYAIDHDIEGVWGGLGEDQRQRLRVKRVGPRGDEDGNG